jgi:hypothetical protein
MYMTLKTLKTRKLFQICIQPLKKLTLPYNSILRFCNPVTFILEEKQSAWNAM